MEPSRTIRLEGEICFYAAMLMFSCGVISLKLVFYLLVSNLNSTSPWSPKIISAPWFLAFLKYIFLILH